ncbi:MAG: hypothetical protein AAFO15_00985 [Pseudomonadota bacterium]
MKLEKTSIASINNSIMKLTDKSSSINSNIITILNNYNVKHQYISHLSWDDNNIEASDFLDYNKNICNALLSIEISSVIECNKASSVYCKWGNTGNINSITNPDDAFTNVTNDFLNEEELKEHNEIQFYNY